MVEWTVVEVLTAAKEAVMTVLRKGKINAGNVAVMLQKARDYKKNYYLLLLGVLSSKEYKLAQEKAKVRATLREPAPPAPAGRGAERRAGPRC